MKGLSGILLQEDENGRKHLVYAVSKKTTTTEAMYHSTKLELMAVVWSVTRLRHLLISIKFKIVTDCQAIVHMNTKKTQNPQIARWATLLSEYGYEIQHRPGEKMAHIDATSQAPVSAATDTMEDVIGKSLEVLIVTDDAANTMAMQHTDLRLKEIIFFKNGNRK